MKTITAYQADDGTLHETPASPATYEGSRALESWLLTDTGYAQVLALAGVS